MGALIGVAELVEMLRADNAEARAIDLQVYAQTLRTYYEAAENVARNGAICSHPRTGQPFENPFLKIRDSQARILSGMDSVESDRVVEALEDLAFGDAPAEK